MAEAAVGPVVIYLDQPEGRKLLSDVRDGRNGCYQAILHSIFSQQTTRAGCGIQSCALLLSANAIGCRLQSSRHHQERSSTDMLNQPVLSVPAKRRKTDDTGEKVVRTKVYNPNHPLNLDKSNKQASPSEKDTSSLATRGGYASSNVVSSLPYTEVGLYTMPQTLTVTNREWVASNGLTMPEVARILQAHGCTVWVVHSASTTVAQFRHDLLDVLSSADSCSGMVINFHRGPLSTGEKARKSHHSPVVAYHKPFDYILILDTAAPIERHFWTSVDAMFTAMLTVDHVSGKSRGYCFFVKSAS